MHGNTKSAHINVRMTPEERAIIAARSASCGMAPSTFMRETALLQGEKPVRVADTEELQALRTDLKRVGNLLNQALRIAHTFGADAGAIADINRCIASVSAVSESLAGLLARATK